MRPILLIAAVALLAACGKSPDEAAVSVLSGGKVDKDDDKVTVQTEKGALTLNTEAGQELPPGFPKNVFLPKDYTVRSSMDMAGSQTQMVDLVLPGASADTFAAAAAAMPGMGWKQVAAIQQPGNSMLVFENDVAMVQYSFMEEEPGKAHLAVAVTKKTP